MKTYQSFSLLMCASLCLLLSVTACSKEGFDGDARISGKVAHHSARIPYATVYIAFGAKELPGTLTTDFDASVIADSAGIYEFDNLKKGDYYLYGLGFDSTISQTVRGGLRVTLAKGDDKTLEVPVTE